MASRRRSAAARPSAVGPAWAGLTALSVALAVLEARLDWSGMPLRARARDGRHLRLPAPPDRARPRGLDRPGLGPRAGLARDVRERPHGGRPGPPGRRRLCPRDARGSLPSLGLDGRAEHRPGASPPRGPPPLPRRRSRRRQRLVARDPHLERGAASSTSSRASGSGRAGSSATFSRSPSSPLRSFISSARPRTHSSSVDSTHGSISSFATATGSGGRRSFPSRSPRSPRSASGWRSCLSTSRKRP